MSGFRDYVANSVVQAARVFSSFNCIFTVFQMAFIASTLYHSAWNFKGQYNNITMETIRFHQLITFALLFLWAILSIALAVLLVWSIRKQSYKLCHTWILCEATMQVFITISAIYSCIFKLFRIPEHLMFVIVLQVLFKCICMLIVWSYAELIKPGSVEVIMPPAASNSILLHPTQRTCQNQDISPPPSYECVCNEVLPCYDEAVKLGATEFI